MEGLRRVTGAVESGGESIYYEVVGDGPTVVLCHGLGGNHAVWWQQIGPFAAAGFRVVTWDQRGFGNSSRRTGRVGPVAAVHDLQTVLDHLGVFAAHIVGQSMGGWTALGHALSHPDRVESLVLTDTLAGVLTPEVTGATAAAGRSPLPGPDAVARHPALDASFSQTAPDRALLYQLISSFGNKTDDAVMMRLLSETRYDARRVRALDVPVLLVAGGRDPLCPPAAMAAVADVLRGARLHVIEGCGHSPYFERPAEWNKVVMAFLNGVAR